MIATRAEATMAKRSKTKSKAKAKRGQERGELSDKEVERAAGGVEAITVKQKVIENPTGE
jgi:hypothetical protein